MSNELQAKWERYVSAWRMASVAEKRETFRSCLAPDCVYTDPLVVARGWDELEKYMLGFHEQIPGGHFVTQQFFAHHGQSVARWKMLSREGATLGEGISYAEYDPQARLTKMTGFFDPSPGAEPA